MSTLRKSRTTKYSKPNLPGATAPGPRTADELFYLKVAVGLNIKTVSEFLESGDSYGVWGRELENLKTAYKKIERAARRV